MYQPEDIVKALETCTKRQDMIAATAATCQALAFDPCESCGYRGTMHCQIELKRDALGLIQGYMALYEQLPDTAKQQPEADPEPWTREKILDTAKQYICGPREEAYGSPAEGFKLTATLWQTYLSSRCVPPDDAICIEPEDVAIMMALLKISRLAATPDHMDGWIDIAGYAALGGEISQRFAREKKEG